MYHVVCIVQEWKSEQKWVKTLIGGSRAHRLNGKDPGKVRLVGRGFGVMRKRSAWQAGFVEDSSVGSGAKEAEGEQRGAPRRRIYRSTVIGPETRTVLAKLWPVLEQHCGVSRMRFRIALEKAGYDVPRQTFDRWITNVHQGGSATSGGEGSGRPREPRMTI